MSLYTNTAPLVSLLCLGNSPRNQTILRKLFGRRSFDRPSQSPLAIDFQE